MEDYVEFGEGAEWLEEVDKVVVAYGWVEVPEEEAGWEVGGGW